MTTQQKSILVILGLIALGLATLFIGLIVMENRQPAVANTARTESCATPDDAQAPLEVCDTGLGGGVTPEEAAAPEGSAAPGGTVTLGAPIGPSKPEPSPAVVKPSATFSPTLLPSAAISPAACPLTAAGGLITEIQAIVAVMPGPGSNGFVLPTDAQMANWEKLVKALAGGDVATACSLAQDFPYQIYRFTDLPYNRETFLLLKENPPVRLGWGTYVFRTGEAQPLIVEVPHPAADWNSEIEAVEIFRKLGAQALLVAGTHRCANQEFSACLGTTIACGQVEPYRISDAGHTAQTLFQAAHQALVPCDGETVALQLHVNSLSTCPDLFVSNGTLFPGSLTNGLFEAMAGSCRDFSVDIADGEAGECGFTGGGGPQAVFTNGCGLSPAPDACTAEVNRPSGADQFISLEQSVAVMKDFDCLIEALQAVLGGTPP